MSNKIWDNIEEETFISTLHSKNLSLQEIANAVGEKIKSVQQDDNLSDADKIDILAKVNELTNTHFMKVVFNLLEDVESVDENIDFSNLFTEDNQHTCDIIFMMNNFAKGVMSERNKKKRQ